MGTKSDIITIIVAITLAHGFFLAIAIALKNSSARRANLILSFFIIIYSYSLTNFLLGFSDLLYSITPLMFTDFPFLMMIGPLFYFYVMELTDNSYKKKWFYSLHFIPFIIAVVLMFPFYSMSSEGKIKYILNLKNIIAYNINIIELGHQIQIFIYLYLSTKLITNYRNRTKQIYSSIDRINLSWLVFFKNALFVCFFLQFLVGLTMLFQINELLPFNFFGLVMISCIVIFSLGYKILLNPEIYSGLLKRKDAIQIKYYKSSLNKEKCDILMDNLRKIMLDENLYLDPELTLDTLADKLSINRHQLSELINKMAGLNFFDFINSYRVEEAKKFLKETASAEKIIAIAMNSGFNTKATFNSAFKKHTGMTPSQFKNQM